MSKILMKNDIRRGLVSQWKYHGTVETTGTWYDSSGNGYNGTLVNGAHVDTNGINLDGTTDYMTRSGVVSTLTNNMTFMGWVKLSADCAGAVFYIGNTGSSGYGLWIWNTSTFGVGRNFDLTLGGVGAELTSTLLSLNTWYFLCAKRTSGTWSGFVNTTTVSGGTTAPLTPSGDTFIGMYTSGSLGINGSVDDVRFYNRVLSDSEILQIYHLTKGNHSNDTFLANWKYTTAVSAGGTWKDATSHNHDATLVGDAYVDSTGLILDGTGDYASVSSQTDFNFEYTDKFTLSVWMKTSFTDSAYYNLLGKWGDYAGYFAAVYSNGALFQLSQSSSAYLYKICGTVNDEAWHFITCTYSGNNALSGMLVYIDSVLTTASSTGNSGTISSITNSYPLYIGRRGDASQMFLGKIDDVRVYNRVLSADEIKQIYDLTRGNY